MHYWKPLTCDTCTGRPTLPSAILTTITDWCTRAQDSRVPCLLTGARVHGTVGYHVHLGVRGQGTGVGSLPPPCSSGITAGLQGWQQAHLTQEHLTVLTERLFFFAILKRQLRKKASPVFCVSVDTRHAHPLPAALSAAFQALLTSMPNDSLLGHTASYFPSSLLLIIKWKNGTNWISHQFLRREGWKGSQVTSKSIKGKINKILNCKS